MFSLFQTSSTPLSSKHRPPKFALALLVVSFYLSSLAAHAFGPADEACLPPDFSTLTPAPGSDLTPVIKSMKAGSTLQLRTGNYILSAGVTIPAGTSTLPTTLTAAAENGQCAQAKITMSGDLGTSNRVTIAGITLERTTNCMNGSSECSQYRAINVTGSENVTIRNNRFVSGGDQIFVGNNSRDVSIAGNIFTGSKKWCIGVRGNPTENVKIIGNRFDHCSDDNIQAENHKNLVISRNEFVGKSSDQILDIKVPKGNTTINYNVIDCRQNSEACVLFHANDYALSSGMKQLFANNTVLGCNSSVNKFLIMGGAKVYDYRDLVVEYNDFIDTNDSKCRIEFRQCDDCIFRHNTIYNGELERYVEASNARIQDNIFYKSNLISASVAFICSHNVFNQVTGTLGSCSSTTFGDPLFMTPPMGLELVSLSSSAWKNASDGGNRGRWQGDINPLGSPTNLTVSNIP
jgi:hypothetical protein